MWDERVQDLLRRVWKNAETNGTLPVLLLQDIEALLAQPAPPAEPAVGDVERMVSEAFGGHKNEDGLVFFDRQELTEILSAAEQKGRREALEQAIDACSKLDATDRAIEAIRALASKAEEPCEACDRAAKHAYSDATTPGFFYDKCEKHRG